MVGGHTVLLYLSLLFVPLSSFAASLNNQHIQFQVASIKAPSNPNQGISYTLNFKKTTYTYLDPRTKKQISGQYRYRILDAQKGIYLINLEERYEKKHSQYSLLLYAQGKGSGLYIFKQERGPIQPEQRMNFGTYRQQQPPQLGLDT